MKRLCTISIIITLLMVPSLVLSGIESISFEPSLEWCYLCVGGGQDPDFNCLETDYDVTVSMTYERTGCTNGKNEEWGGMGEEFIPGIYGGFGGYDRGISYVESGAPPYVSGTYVSRWRVWGFGETFIVRPYLWDTCSQQVSDVSYGIVVTPTGCKAFESLIKVSGDGQNQGIDMELDEPLVVQVVNGAGEVMPNVAITWSIAGPPGASGQLVNPLKSFTDNTGKAQTTVKLGNLLGSYQISATCSI